MSTGEMSIDAFIHSFIHSYKKYLLSVWCVVSTVIDSWDTAMNKADKGLALKEFLFLQRGCRQKICQQLREEDTGACKKAPEECVDIPVGELREIMLELRTIDGT